MRRYELTDAAWVRDGLIGQILSTLHLQLDEEGYIDWSQFDVDGTSIRADRSAAGALKKRKSRKSLTIMDLDEAEGVGAQSFIW